MLYLVATPIGNLEDITLRALRILRQVSLIAAEDTRKTQRLLARYDIHTPLTSYHEHNKMAKLPMLLEALAKGDVALVSEAGMPGISDPGYELVRAALEQGIPVVPVPGPSAPLAALAASGLPTDRFLFLGFLPRRPTERRNLLADLAHTPYTLVAFEAPHRLRKTLDDLAATLGPQRRMAICRELTKIHEEILRGTVAEIQAHFREVAPKGEFTLVIEGENRGKQETVTCPQIQERLRALLAAGLSRSEAARQVAEETGYPRREVYRIACSIKSP